MPRRLFPTDWVLPMLAAAKLLPYGRDTRQEVAVSRAETPRIQWQQETAGACPFRGLRMPRRSTHILTFLVWSSNSCSGSWSIGLTT
jgi:hypothetical protein